MYMQGNEIQERREQFRVNIRRSEIGQFLQQKRTVSRPADREIDLNLLIRNLGAQPYNMKILIKNQGLLNKEHLIDERLLKKMSKLDATSNKDVMEMLTYLMMDEELSQLILKEQDLKVSLIKIIVQLVETLVQDEDYQFWNLIKIIVYNPQLSQSIRIAIFKLLVVYITTNSYVDQLLLQILEIIISTNKGPSRQLVMIIKQDSPQFFKVLQLILEKSKDNKILFYLLAILKMFIRIIQNQDDLHEIINKHLIQVIQGLIYVSLNIAIESIYLLDAIMDTQLRKFIIQNDTIIDDLNKLIQFGNDSKLIQISFKLITRLKHKMTDQQFPNNRLDIIIHDMLANYDLGAVKLGLEYLLSENYQIQKFENQLIKLIDSQNEKISDLSIALLDQLKQ